MQGCCCRNAWDIEVEDDIADNILSLDWHKCSSLPDNAVSPFEYSKTEKNKLVLKTVGDACSFLADDGKCRLQNKYGFDVKPHACRTFPFSFAGTPDGIHIGLSFACPAVCSGKGKIVSEHKRMLEKLLEDAVDPWPVAEPVKLDLTTALEWEEYNSIEKGLSEILGNEAESLKVCLAAGHTWLGMLRRMLLAAPSEKKKIINFYLSSTAADNYAKAFASAKKKPVRHPLKRILLGTCISFRHSMRPGQSRISVTAKLILNNIRHWLQAGSVKMYPLDTGVPYIALALSSELLQNKDAEKLLRRYFLHALSRKDLIVETDLFWGYCYFILSYGLIEWYAAALQEAGSPPDPEKALMLVEKNFVSHSNFNRIFLSQPVLENKFRSIFEKPNFARLMLS